METSAGRSAAYAMSEIPSTSIYSILRRRNLTLVVLGLVAFLVLAGTRPMGAGEPGLSNQCVACHTAATKLKALTPPDPPISETGEG